jgi:hypothetical protein
MNIPVEADNDEFLASVKTGDSLYVAEYSSDDDTVSVIEYEVKDTHPKKSTIDGVDAKWVFDIVDKRFPKTMIKNATVTHGFHPTKAAALLEFCQTIDRIRDAAMKAYELAK